MEANFNSQGNEKTSMEMPYSSEQASLSLCNDYLIHVLRPCDSKPGPPATRSSFLSNHHFLTPFKFSNFIPLLAFAYNLCSKTPKSLLI